MTIFRSQSGLRKLFIHRRLSSILSILSSFTEVRLLPSVNHHLERRILFCFRDLARATSLSLLFRSEKVS